jgi:choline dehydrogenase
MQRRTFIRHAGGAVAALSAIRTLARQPSPEFDYVVVGAGSSGCVVAGRLSEDPSVRVLLIEAGGTASDPSLTTPGRWVTLIGSPFDWGYATEPEAGLQGRRITFPRGKVVGGSSAINAMTYIRGNRLDFDGWARAGNAGWSYDEVLPIFRDVEANSRGASEYRGAAGPLAVSDCRDPHAAHEAFLAAAAELGYESRPDFEFSAPRPENGAGYYQKNIKDGRRHNAADAFLTPALSRRNLRVITGARATRITTDRQRATGVEYVHESRREQVRAAREVILCSGVVDSPKLLLLSGIGPADHLRGTGIPVVLDLPGVGTNLQDHLKLSIRWNGLTTLPPSTVTAGLFVRSRGASGEGATTPPDLQFYVGRGLDQPDRFVTITVSLVRPRSRGDVRLSSSDPLVAPRIRGNYLQDSLDVAALVDGARLARTLGQSSAYAKLRADEVEPGPSVTSEAALAEFARRASDTIYHPAGTCRMGTDPQAVVDPQLRVRGIAALRIADASVMPDVVSATTHAACVMIGARAVNLLRGPASAAAGRFGEVTP